MSASTLKEKSRTYNSKRVNEAKQENLGQRIDRLVKNLFVGGKHGEQRYLYTANNPWKPRYAAEALARNTREVVGFLGNLVKDGFVEGFSIIKFIAKGSFGVGRNTLGFIREHKSTAEFQFGIDIAEGLLLTALIISMGQSAREANFFSEFGPWFWSVLYSLLVVFAEEDETSNNAVAAVYKAIEILVVVGGAALLIEQTQAIVGHFDAEFASMLDTQKIKLENSSLTEADLNLGYHYLSGLQHETTNKLNLAQWVYYIAALGANFATYAIKLMASLKPMFSKPEVAD